jgi:MFS family permease
MLRSIAGCSATSNLFNHLQIAIFVLYVTRELGIGAVLLGLIFSCGSVGTLLGALSAGSASRRFGLGQTIIGAALLVGTGYACRWLAAGPLVIAVPVLVIGQFLIGFATTMYNINQISLRQAITPERLLGRMNASMRFLVWGTIPIGALIGGGLGQLIGLRPTLGLGGIGVLLSFLWVFFSPLRTLRDQPGVIA